MAAAGARRRHPVRSTSNLAEKERRLHRTPAPPGAQDKSTSSACYNHSFPYTSDPPLATTSRLPDSKAAFCHLLLATIPPIPASPLQIPPHAAAATGPGTQVPRLRGRCSGELGDARFVRGLARNCRKLARKTRGAASSGRNRTGILERIPQVAGAALLFSVFYLGNSLSIDYYAKTCPKVDKAVKAAVKLATSTDKTVPAALLRMHFHDCFIRGCDGSVLLNSTKSNTAEKDGPPNISLHGFYVIDNAKKAVEALCPGVVSCADILALAARDAVALSGGPSWDVPKGRMDGRVSKASDTRQLPAPTFNFSQLKQNFAQRGLKTIDLVALSGGHTLGFAHCSSFQNRIHNFDNTHDVDPFLQPSFAARLRRTCPAQNTAKNAGATMDSTTAVFDNVYYKMILQGQSLFTSDQTLLTHPRTRALVTEFAGSQKVFNDAFVKSMIKMGSLTGGQEVRRDCKFVR